MKKILFLFAFFFTSSLFGNAQVMDSNVVARVVDRGNKPVVSAIDNQTKLLKDSVLNTIKNNKMPTLKTNETVADFITFLPIALFLFILISTLFKLKKDKVKLSDFLIDKDARVAIKKEEATATIATARATEAQANAIRVNPQAFGNANLALQPLDQPMQADADTELNNNKTEQSTSRLVAFISGITSVGLAACITSFYFYKSFSGEVNPSIGNLATVLYGLGLGVLPYGFNKIANALK